MSGKEKFLLLILTVLVAVLLAGFNWLASPDLSKRNFEVFNEMMHSPAYKSQSANPNFEDGLTQRVPPAGTIPRGGLGVSVDSGEAGRLAAAALSNPVAETDAVALARGALLYQHNCRPCHGENGEGNGPVAQRGFPPPPSLAAPNAKGLADGTIFHIITFGQNNMPGLAVQVEEADRWKVIRHVRTLQGGGANQ